MIRINLLPHRVWRRKREKRRLFLVFFLSFLVFSLLSTALYLNVKRKVSSLRMDLRKLDLELSSYREIEKDVAKLRKTKEAIEKKLRNIELLRTKRVVSPFILYSLAKGMPSGDIWLRSITRSGNTLEVVGFCADETLLSKLMRNLKRIKPFEKVTLKSLKRSQEKEPFRFDLILEVAPW